MACGDSEVRNLLTADEKIPGKAREYSRDGDGPTKSDLSVGDLEEPEAERICKGHYGTGPLLADAQRQRATPQDGVSPGGL